jgi:hypothetical protein
MPWDVPRRGQKRSPKSPCKGVPGRLLRLRHDVRDQFYMGNHSRINETNDSVRSNVWYELKRQGITIPFPIRTLHVERKKAPPLQEDQAEAFSILRGERLFDCLSEDQLNHMVNQARLKLFGRGEP